MERNFMEMLRAKWAEDKFLCVGLDSEYKKIPQFIHDKFIDSRHRILDTIIEFNKMVIDQTKDLVCAYKPNIAFYEAHGEIGIAALFGTKAYLDDVAPDVPIILDGKRADIGNTNMGYIAGIFDELEADAITVHPYLGSEAMKPFLDQKDKGVIVLCRTSNSGAGEFQDLEVRVGNSQFKKLFEVVAETVRDKWNINGNCLLVAGATYPEELQIIREIIGDIPILIPGVGTQGGSLKQVVENGLDRFGTGVIINSSSGIIFTKGNIREAAQETHDLITEYRKEVMELRAQSIH